MRQIAPESLIRDAGKNFREAVSFKRIGWRTRLLKLDLAVGMFVAWSDVKLRGWKDGDLEPQMIEEWTNGNGEEGGGQ